jgi:hypothetical protein
VWFAGFNECVAHHHVDVLESRLRELVVPHISVLILAAENEQDYPNVVSGCQASPSSALTVSLGARHAKSVLRWFSGRSLRVRAKVQASQNDISWPVLSTASSLNIITEMGVVTPRDHYILTLTDHMCPRNGTSNENALFTAYGFRSQRCCRKSSPEWC